MTKYITICIYINVYSDKGHILCYGNYVKVYTYIILNFYNIQYMLPPSLPLLYHLPQCIYIYIHLYIYYYYYSRVYIGIYFRRRKDRRWKGKIRFMPPAWSSLSVVSSFPNASLIFDSSGQFLFRASIYVIYLLSRPHRGGGLFTTRS